MTDPIRWGILGTGGIARSFATALRHVPDAELVAVGSRAQDSADRFAAEHAVPRGYGSYEALVDDDEVDVVYVATPHTRHAADMALALEAEKHVLGEKPFTISAEQSARIAELAAARAASRWRRSGAGSSPRTGSCGRCSTTTRSARSSASKARSASAPRWSPAHRLFDPELGGGALLDLGCYPVQLAHFVLGTPTSVSAVARIGETGVDEDTIVAMGFAGGAVAVAQSAIRTPLPCDARITGTAGTIELPAFMHCPEHVDVTVGGETRRIDTPLGEAPLAFQVEEVHACLRAGQLESPTMPLTDTLAIAGTLDRARERSGSVPRRSRGLANLPVGVALLEEGAGALLGVVGDRDLHAVVLGEQFGFVGGQRQGLADGEPGAAHRQGCVAVDDLGDLPRPVHELHRAAPPRSPARARTPARPAAARACP